MSTPYKLRFVSDNVHGSIPFSSVIENDILGDPLFNRLQCIKQNSTAYKTYPSLEYSRFIHSLGTMYIASNILHSSFLNTSTSCSANFLNSFNAYFNAQLESLQLYFGSEDFTDSHIFGIQENKARFSNKIKKLNTTPSSIFKNLFNNDKIFYIYNSNIKDAQQIAIYNILLQSLRVASLFHDLGHPPFSHATEFAVQDFFKSLDPNSSKKNTDFYKIINYYLRYSSKVLDKPYFKPLHESVTLVFASNIFDHLINSLINVSDPEKIDLDLLFYVSIIKISCLNILLGHPLIFDSSSFQITFDEKKFNPDTCPGFETIGSIINGDVDSDRMDFVLRDGRNSGFSNTSYNLSRLISNFSLQQSEVKFVFAPSIRSLNDLEKFLKERLSIYKYIIFHHNVVKTDLVLYKTLILVFDLIVNENNTELEGHWKYFWKYIKQPESNKNNFAHCERFIISASAWNEDWIMSAMNISYQFLFKKIIESNDDEVFKNPKEKKLYLLLKELIFNRRSLVSLWKKNHSYTEFVNSFIEKIKISDDQIRTISDALLLAYKKTPTIKPQMDQEKFDAAILKLNNKILVNFNNVTNCPNDLINSPKFDLIKDCLEFIYYINPAFDNELESSLTNSIKQVYKLDIEVYAKIIAKRLNPGISKNYEVISYDETDHNKVKLQTLIGVSSIVSELELTASISPQFYIFFTQVKAYDYVKPINFVDKEHLYILNKLSDLLVSEFILCLNKILKQLKS